MADVDPPDGPVEILRAARAELVRKIGLVDAELATWSGGRNGYPWITPESVREELRIIAQTRLPTGIPFLDKAFKGGLPGATVVSLVGPPGSCKSALAIQIGLNRARQTSKRLYVYSPDQGGLQPLGRLAERFGDIVASDEAFSSYRQEIGALIHVADERLSRVTLNSFRDAVLAADDVAAVIIDTPQTIATAEDLEERQQIDFTMETSRLLAGKLIVPVLVASHASRAATAARKKEDRLLPRAAGLGSAKIEHRSQVVIFMEEVEGQLEDRLEVDIELPKVSFGRRAGKARLRLDLVAWRLVEVDKTAVDAEEEARMEVAHGKQTKAVSESIIKELQKHPEGLSGRQLCETVLGFRWAEIRSALKVLYGAGVVFSETRQGRGGGLLWRLAK